MATNDKPLTDERLAEIAAYWESVYHNYYEPDIQEPPDTLHDAICHVDELLGVIRSQRAVIEQQQTEIATMRPVVEAVAGELTAIYWNRETHRFCCRWCDASHKLHMSQIEHASDCPYEQARAYVAQHPATGEGE